MSKNGGVTGLGAMGLGVARSLLREGFAVHACDVRKEVLDQFAGEGGIACDSPGQMAENCEIVVIVVVNAAQTEAVLFGPEGALSRLRPGSVVVACATVDPVFALDLGKRLAERQILLIDAPISGGAARAAQGQLSMMTSGPSQAYTKVQEVLDAMAAKVDRLERKRQRLNDST